MIKNSRNVLKIVVIIVKYVVNTNLNNCDLWLVCLLGLDFNQVVCMDLKEVEHNKT